MAAIGERSLAWFAAERVERETASAEMSAATVDVPAWVQLYSALLFRVALSVLRNTAEAEDVVQDCFVRVLRQKEKLSAVVDVRPWLVRIAWNLALDRRRSVRPEQMDSAFAAELAALTVPADEALAQAGRMAQVLDAIERLPARERESLLLSAMDELSIAEIGKVLGRSESSVRSLLFRARAHLRERLNLEGGAK